MKFIFAQLFPGLRLVELTSLPETEVGCVRMSHPLPFPLTRLRRLKLLACSYGPNVPQ